LVGAVGLNFLREPGFGGPFFGGLGWTPLLYLIGRKGQRFKRKAVFKELGNLGMAEVGGILETIPFREKSSFILGTKHIFTGSFISVLSA